jgi:hypothetical protein
MPEDEGKKEALAQLAIWLTANLERTRDLYQLVKDDADLEDCLQPTLGYTIMVMIGMLT